MSDSDECIKTLNKWIISKKHEIYDEFVTKSTNTVKDLSDYINTCANLGNKVIHAINNEDDVVLRSVEWPEELMECIRDVIIRIDIIDNITNLLITYPENNSPKHMEEIKAENSGLN